MSSEDLSSSVEPDLWVTARCLDDDLKVPTSPQDARQRHGEHALVDAFVDKRSTRPEGQETIGLETRGTWSSGTGQLPARRIGDAWRLSRSALLSWLAVYEGRGDSVGSNGRGRGRGRVGFGVGGAAASDRDGEEGAA